MAGPNKRWPNLKILHLHEGQVNVCELKLRGQAKWSNNSIIHKINLRQTLRKKHGYETNGDHSPSQQGYPSIMVKMNEKKSW